MVHHKAACSHIDAFDMWALHKILRIPYTRHVTNVEVRATTRCHPLSHLVTDRHSSTLLTLFGHIARSSPQEDHHCAVAAMIRGLPPDWKRPLGRPSHTCLRAVETDLGQQNIGLASAWRTTGKKKKKKNNGYSLAHHTIQGILTYLYLPTITIFFYV